MSKMDETKLNLAYADDLANTGEGVEDASSVIRK